MKKGIAKIKILLVFVITLGESFAKKMEDKKISLVEGFGLAMDLRPLPSIIRDRKEIAAEFLDLDPDEKKELIELVALELDLPNDEVELKIEQGFEFGISMLDWLDAFKKKAA